MDSDDDDDGGDQPKTSIMTLILWATIIIVTTIIIGILFIRYLFQFCWFDCYYHSNVYLSGIGDPDLPQTKPQKAFVAIYSIVGGSIIIGITVTLMTEIFRRIFNVS